MGKLKVAVLCAAVLFITAVTVFGMGNTMRPVERPLRDISNRELADDLVGRVFSAYSNFTMPVFMDIVSDAYAPDKMQLINDIGDAFYRVEVIEINHFLNMVTGSGDTLAVDFSWEKRVYNKDTGNMDKSEGDAVFVFRKNGDEWLLVRIRGNNPLL